jgi:3-hydroxymyristoyl/3-hydroxydecanoyl-(acyl carrier protein) dehydratase
VSRMEFEFQVPADHPSLPGHFPGHPVVPGVLLLDHVLQAVSRLTGQDVAGLRQVKFASVLLPGEAVRGSCEVEGARFSFRVVTKRKEADVVVAEGVGGLSVRLPS